MLLGLLSLAYIKRRKRIRVIVGLILGLGSYFCWFSTAEWWTADNLILHQQRLIAIILWIFAAGVLISNSARKENRKSFSEVVRKEVVQKQKSRCARCKRKLEEYGADFHHKNGDRSNNKLSNCQMLCTPCHRRKHVM
jgi:hypothetical protein